MYRSIIAVLLFSIFLSGCTNIDYAKFYPTPPTSRELIEEGP